VTGVALAVLMLLVAGAAAAQGVTKTRVTYPAPTADLTIPGTLLAPVASGPVPAVVIAHGSGGVDGRGDYHAEALNRAGIATLEIDMWGPRGLKGGPRGRPRRLAETYPDVYGALKFLVQRPDVDAARIGIMGFSWGGALALAAASARLTEQFTGGIPKFAAHVAFYPTCWSFLPRAAELTMTGAPVKILVGDKDDYDAPDACPRLIDALPPESRALVALSVYPGGYHGWDASQRATFFDPSAALGKGGQVRFFPDGKLAERSRRETVEFFAQAFGLTPPTKP
jgi:dienelactone hydrolase